MERKRFLEQVRKRFSLRLHMSVLLAATVGAGLLVNWTLWSVGVEALWCRTLVAVVVTYPCFLLFARVWLWTMVRRRESEMEMPVLLEVGGNSEVSLDGVFRAGGGRFSGGGASGRFDAGVRAPSLRLKLDDVGSTSSGGSFDIDGEGLVLVIALVLLAVSIILAGAYLVWEAPVILAETLFEFSLAGALLRKLNRSPRRDWLGHLFGLTWKPFAVVFFVTVLFCSLVLFLRPQSRVLPDLWDAAPVSAQE